MATLEQGSTVKLQPIDAQTIVNEVIQSLKAAAESKEIEIREKTSGTSTNVLADPTYFRQVIENLISNAVKFSPTRKDVQLSIEAHDRFLEIRVRDYGHGVPADEEHRLFKRFSKLSTQPTGGESSSGLGLSLVKQYMELMGGTVRHERPIDGGAVFIAKFLKA
jgi:signal transduction histidine kinase